MLGRKRPDARRADAEPYPLTMRAHTAWARAALVAVLVVALDQLTKSLVENSIVPGEEHRLLPGIELVDARNHGVAFGFLPGHHVAVTIVIGVALAALLVYFLRHSTRPLIWLPTGMLIGGALGNIIDRLRDGSVTDFVKLPLGWPPFNLADASITFGVLALLFVVEGPHGGSPADPAGTRAGGHDER
jgi:signal peptidase II